VSRAAEASASPLEAARSAHQEAEAARAAAARRVQELAAAETASAQAAQAAQAAAAQAEAARVAALKQAEEATAAARMMAEQATAARAAAEAAVAARTEAANQSTKQEQEARAAWERWVAEEAFDASEALNRTLAEIQEAEKQRTAKDRVSAEKAAARDTTAAAATKANAEADGATAEAARQAAAKAAEEAAHAVTERDAAAAAVTAKTAELPARYDAQAACQARLLGGLKPLAAAAWDRDKARHLLWRAGFGGTAEEVDRLCALGLHRAVDSLVDYHRLPEPSVPLDVRAPEKETPFEHRLHEPARLKLGSERTTRRFEQLARMRAWWLRRMVESPRPLEEKLTLMWHGHFAVAFTKNENPQILHRQNRLFREYASGDFGGLLRGTAQDPAMIAYLDNQVNFKGAGNENLGREILELFSMGEGQGYTEQDLREAARALTGYSYEYATGQFKFIASRHDETPKTVFGQTGPWGGDELVDLILRQPSTARFVVTKLFRFFVHDHPSPETLEALAGALRSSQYTLTPVLRNLFLSEEFYRPEAMNEHIKSPAELVVGSLRVLGAKDVNYSAVDQAMQEMGQTLFEPPNVKGWDGGRDWINAARLLARYNGVASIVEPASVDLAAWLEKSGATSPDAAAEALARALLSGPLPESKRAALRQYLSDLPPAAQWGAQRDAVNGRLRAAVIALMSTPEYQVL
jgi:uncharacterized protein (DUF1800 family)